MSVLDTFYLLFKNDAGSTRKDVADLEKQIDSLRAKGKLRSEEESKQLKESISLHKELTKEMREAENQTDKLVDKAAAAAASLVGYSALKSGIADVNKFNAGLYTMSKITGQNITQLQAMANLAASTGGSREGGLSDVQAYFQNAASRGITPGPYADFLKTVHDQIKGLPKGQQFLRANAAGVTDAGFLRAVMGSDAEFDDFYEKAKKVSYITDEIGDNAQKTEAALSRVGAAQQGAWTKLANAINPALQGLFDWDSSHGGVTSKLVDTGINVGGGLLFLKYAKRILFGAAKTKSAVEGAVEGGAALGGAEAAGGIGIAGIASIVAGVLSILGLGDLIIRGRGSLMARGSQGLANWIDEYRHGDEDKARWQRFHSGEGAGAEVSADDMTFWTSKGYTAEQAAGIIANMKRESQGNPGARGDGGRAVGLFQWHPDRVANIMSNTGINVSTASYQQQLEAAAWEMKNGRPQFNDDYFRTLGNAGAAGAYFSDKFESPANPNEAIIRGKSALGLASQFPGFASEGGANSMSVKIDKIDVHTQAEDAKGIANSIGGELSSALRALQGNFDDGEFM